ncbi:hypothetical protein PIB30_114676, partial [Stylosanthes scabra]|nr:hypothetical protein [Stylosanthes scabra]
MPGYWIWTEHGEVDEVGVNRNRIEPVANMDEQDERVFVANRNQGEHVNWMDNHARYEEMMRDAFGMEGMEAVEEEEPNPEAARFYSLLESANEPLFE